MRLASVAIPGACLLSHGFGYAAVIDSNATRQVRQEDLIDTTPQSKPSEQQLHGRFLHITGTVLFTYLLDLLEYAALC